MLTMRTCDSVGITIRSGPFLPGRLTGNCRWGTITYSDRTRYQFASLPTRDEVFSTLDPYSLFCFFSVYFTELYPRWVPFFPGLARKILRPGAQSFFATFIYLVLCYKIKIQSHATHDLRNHSLNFITNVW